jgi:hypothetical protein
MSFKSILVALCLVSVQSTVLAKGTYSIPRVDTQPTINGVLDKSEWASATQVELAFDISPGDSTPAPVRTTAYMMEDGEQMYIAFKAYDPNPENILAYIRDRDGLFQDDFVGVILDTFNDERKGYEFFVNPMGSQGDLTRDDTLHNEDASWDTVWDSAGQVVEDGYIVEMAIPYRALRFKPDLENQTWGIQFLRIYPRDSRTVLADGRSNRELDCTLCQVNKVSGMPNLKSTDANFDVTPTVTYVNNEQRDLNPTGDWQDQINDTEVGADLRWAITEDWILNASINPDFSQVEADAGQLDINTTFSLFYPEARPFFLEGADYFKSMNRLVHTRNIADPEYGLKVTGKSNGYSLGVITASDDSTSFLIPSSQGSYVVNLEDESSEAFIVRGQVDVGEKNNIGVSLTSRTATDYKNQVMAIDGKYYFTKKDVFTYQVMNSNSDNPDSISIDDDGERFMDADQSDNAYTMNYRHNEEDYSFRASYNDFGKDFRADMGFIGKVDYKQVVIGGNYTWRGDKDSKWTQWGLFGDWDKTEDQSGKMLEQESEIHFNLRGPMQFNTNLGVVERERYYNGEYFDESVFMMWFQFKPLSSLTVGNFMMLGDQIDYAHTELGELVLIEPYVNWQVGKHLSVNVSHTNQKLDVLAKQMTIDTPNGNGQQVDFAKGKLFDAKLTDIRLAYQFNTKSRLSLTLQTSSIDKNPLLYSVNFDDDLDNDASSSTKRFGTQLIYSYKLNPQSLMYLGYSDNAVESEQILSLEKFDKTFFAKFSYLWQN